jgi:hypothetical protein
MSAGSNVKCAVLAEYGVAIFRKQGQQQSHRGCAGYDDIMCVRFINIIITAKSKKSKK